MKIIDEIKKLIPNRFRMIAKAEFVNPFGIQPRKSFGSALWINICELLTDICEDVTLNFEGNKKDIYTFSAFKSFFYLYGSEVLQVLFDYGFCVIGWDGVRFWIMQNREYTLRTQGDVTSAMPINPSHQIYVMRSSTFQKTNQSDKALVSAWIDLADDILNASATINNRLGVVVVASPKNSANVNVILTKTQKEEIEKELRTDYGALRNQSQVMVMPREMNWETINLAGLDLKTFEKIRNITLAICDRIKVPANQVAIVDANAMKSLSNGSELREGDKLKYKSFRRLFERTFADFARAINLKISYTIDGEPIDLPKEF